MKKYFSVFLIGFLLSNLMIFNVKAETDFLAVDEIVKETNNYYNSSLFTLVNDSTDKVIKAISKDDNSILWSMNYTDEGIMFDATGEEINKDNIEKRFSDSLYLSFIMTGTYKASGYSDAQIDNVLSWLSDAAQVTNLFDYDKYGVEVVSEPYSINYEDALGNTKLSGDFIRKMRVSFEKSKIKNLFTEYGDKANPNVEKEENIEIGFGDVSTNAIAIKAKLEGGTLEKGTKCSIYRSESVTGTFKLIGNVVCDGSDYLYDKNLESGKEYFYKATVFGKTTFSSVSNKKTLGTKAGEVNSDTGINSLYVVLAFVLVSVFASILIFGQKLYIKEQ